jgi:hypothetical protein
VTYVEKQEVDNGLNLSLRMGFLYLIEEEMED